MGVRRGEERHESSTVRRGRSLTAGARSSHTPAGSGRGGRIVEEAGGRNVAAVFDFVAAQPTIDLGASLLGAESELVLVGAGAGKVDVGLISPMPNDASVRAPYWGSRSELMEVLELARAGLVHVETERFSLDEAPEAYRRLHEGTLRGRAVVVP